jgi:hypothetical protein
LFSLPQQVSRSQRISSRAKTALYYLASLCGAQNHCFPYVETIAQGMSAGVRTAQRAISELIDHGLIKRKLRPYHQSSVYTLVCLEWRGPTRADRRREERESRISPEVIHTPSNRGDNPDTPFLREQTTQENNDHYSTEYVHPTVQDNSQQGYPQGNNGFKAETLEKPKRMHPAEARLLAEDIAETLGYTSFKYWLKIAWRASEQAIYEALSFVKGEMLEGHAENPCGLFVYRLRQFHGLRI